MVNVQTRSALQHDLPPQVTHPDAVALAKWVGAMLDITTRRLNSPSELRLEPLASEPQRPRVGMVVYADGTHWNPGSGEGIYYYKSTAVWTLLG